jgi:enamine deaminase RidA (YjgF/YER057c/UK114 family)
MAGAGLVTSCITLQTERKDAFVVALENPQQTPAYAYGPQHSPQSPKFSRAMALVLGRYATTWVSGTASIVNSESRHAGDIARQTEQTIDNIERLVAPENFAVHGVRGAGAGLSDFAKIRVYLKRAEDFAQCRAVCERRFGSVPAIYAIADVCRPELLVEIEGIAFSKYSAAPA